MTSKRIMAMLFIARILVASVALVIAGFAQGNQERVLLVTSCESAEPCGVLKLHRFVFEAGRLKSDGIIHELSGRTTLQYVPTRVYFGRYVISARGEVFDLQTKTLHAEETGSLARVEGNVVYIDKINFQDREASFTYGFDLDSKKYHRYTQPNFYSLRNGSISESGLKAVTYDNVRGAFFVMTRTGKHPSDFTIYRAQGMKHKVRCEKCPYDDPTVASIWIDNDRFLTQRANGELVIFDTSLREWEDLVTIPISRKLTSRPDFVSDKAGKIYYRADKLYRLDIANKQFTETTEYGLGSGFRAAGFGPVRSFSFHEKKLGSFISTGYRATGGYLAAEFQDDGPVGDPTGIRVWGEEVGSWTTIRIKYRAHIIGWLDE